MGSRQINWLNYKFLPADGYGRYGLYFVRALHRAGVDVTPALRDTAELPGWLTRMAGIDWSRLTVACLPPCELRPLAGRQWNLTMYECSAIPEGWANEVNRLAERLIVPCVQNAEAFRRAGVEKPIHVVPGGTSPEDFPLMGRTPNGNRPYTFLALGDRGSRKGEDIAWRAFFQEFGNGEDVRLIVKARPSSRRFAEMDLSESDRRVSIWLGEVESMAEVYEQADCFVFPSKGEGWGMPPREAAMMGLPVIATRWGGLEEGIDQWAIPVERFMMMPSMLPVKNGEWAVADVDEVAAHMRWCYEHPAEAKAKGLEAAAWLRANQTWDHAALKLLALMDEVL
jgi:hypothetical protein